MKLRYYLRGLGIGIVVTAIIMSFTKKPEELTDAEIKIRAAKLGMIEESVLADIAKNDKEIITDKKEDLFEENVESENAEEVINNGQDTEDTIENQEQDIEKIDNSEENVLESEVKTEKELMEETISNHENENDKIAENEQVENYIVISIEAGNGSEVISQRVFEAGLVNSALEYNRYLITNGYAKRLRAGNHEIPAGASEEEIAKILCGMN